MVAGVADLASACCKQRSTEEQFYASFIVDGTFGCCIADVIGVLGEYMCIVGIIPYNYNLPARLYREASKKTG